MAEKQLKTVITQLQTGSTTSYATASTALSKAKLALLQLNALTPSPSLSPVLYTLARSTYEQGALYSIRAKKADAFTRYVAQLEPFYTSGAPKGVKPSAEQSKITGLYLLLLLTQGRYGEFHSQLESLTARGHDVEDDKFLGYPIRLERWLMEGSYDQVWRAMKRGEAPCDEYGVFSEILRAQIRSEIASSSERAYPSLPLSSTKSLLFLDSEGDVISYARSRGWLVRDSTIFFPDVDSSASTAEAGDGEAVMAGDKEMSQMVIKNTLGYARELETIV
ncbi:hypothetical protein MKZ38_002869 [Zalerion maritima]|uniref:PCI domain-containing protein n=1 Tax=Zalerion maritima TaxID=339359 RepID=A0AAD5RYK0_9PEZI|nr:hypothetical protein MKZ38_002869 [Zalerion maritima]